MDYKDEIGAKQLNVDKELLTWLFMRSIANAIMKPFNKGYINTFVSNEEKGLIELKTRCIDKDIYEYFEPKIYLFIDNINANIKYLIQNNIINNITINYKNSKEKNEITIEIYS